VLDQSLHVMLKKANCAAWLRRTPSYSVSARAIHTVDYAKSAQIMKLGYEAAGFTRTFAGSGLLSTMRIGRSISAAHGAQSSDIPVPQFIEVEGTKCARSHRRHSLRKTLSGQPLEPEKLGRSADRLTGVGRYDSAGTGHREERTNRPADSSRREE